MGEGPEARPVRPHRLPESYQEKMSKKPKVRSSEEYEAFFPRYPVCEDGYMVSFDYTQDTQYKEMLEKYGFVVIKLLESDECDRSVEEFFFDVNRRTKDKKKDSPYIPIEPDKPWTWETKNWPSPKTKFLLDTPAFTPQAFSNRTNPKLYHIYQQILQRSDLWCNIDNWGFFRGTKNLKILEPSGEIVQKDRPDWRYSLLLHWDMNPWYLDLIIKKGIPEPFQGLVALVDCPEEVGGFLVVPGSHQYMYTWIEERIPPNFSKHSLRPPPDDPMQQYVQKIPLRKGEMVIWYTRTAHCNFPNYSDKMRIIQYVRCLPATQEGQDLDRYAPRRIHHQYKEDKFTDWGLPHLTPLGRKLTGLEEWES